MSYQASHSSWVVYLSLLFALCVYIVPLSESLVWYRPHWVLLCLLYWVMALPERVGMGTAWVAGLVLDALGGGLFGSNALALVLVTYFSELIHQRLRMFTSWQQCIIVFIAVTALQLWTFLLNHWLTGLTWNWQFILPGLVSALLWPWIFMLLRGMRRKLYVS